MSQHAAARPWETESLAFEVWKYHGGIGGADKDRMVKIVAWLLGFSSAIIGFLASATPTEPRAGALLNVLGILVSVLAALVALLYGGYATWNWAIADRIAEDYRWQKLLPGYKPIHRPKWSAAPALWLAKPRPDGIAPIFWIFFFVSLLSAIAHVVLLACGASTEPGRPLPPG
jgi:hypothetical protein